MKKNRIKILSILLIIFSIISLGFNVYAHSGRTDSNGGHKDNNNKSGLGSYHYHCGGNPAHLHTNGVCPYSSSKSSTSSSSSSIKTTTTTAPVTIEVTGIQINENINSIEVGESKKLTATITPDNATDKNITWKSSDENVATINSSGEIVAKKTGNVTITASTSNGKTSIINIDIKEAKDNSVITNDLTTNKDNINTDNQENSNPLGGILTLGLLGGGGYWGYKKYKKLK